MLFTRDKTNQIQRGGGLKLNKNPALGPELVVNGTFQGAAGWININWTLENGYAECNGVAGADLSQAGILPGLTPKYRLAFETFDASYSGPGLSVFLGGFIVPVTTVTYDGKFIYRYSPTAGGVGLNFRSLALNDFIGSIRNISVREIL